MEEGRFLIANQFPPRMDDTSLLGKRTRRVPPHFLILPSNNAFVPQSPLTPSSVFSFELSNSPALISGSRRRTRSPSTVFNFEFPIGSLERIEECSRYDTESNEDSQGGSRRGSGIPQTTNWHVVKLLTCVLFIVRLQFTVYFASTWPFLEEIDRNATIEFFSLVGSLYSTGVAISAPLFAWCCQNYGLKGPMHLSFFLMISTNLAFIFIEYIPSNRRYCFMLIRFIVGIAAGSSSILNTYWCSVTSPSDRASAAGLIDAAMSLGTAFGPLFQLISSLIGYPGTTMCGIPINMYTVPGMVATCAVILAAFLLFNLFEEPKIERIREKEDNCEIVPDRIERLPFFVCAVVKIIQMLYYANLETIGTMFMAYMFALNPTETAQLSSVLVSASGFLGFAFLIIYVWSGMARRVDNRLGVIIGFAICLAYLAATTPWPFYTKTINHKGCTWSWCNSTPTINFALFAVSHIFLFGVGFPLVNVHGAALLSSVIGGRQQTVWHSYVMSLSTAARIVGPLGTAELLGWKGIQITWQLQAVIISAMIVLIILTFRKLGILKEEK